MFIDKSEGRNEPNYRARGGFEVDIFWRNGQLDRVEVRSTTGNKCRLRYRNRTKEFPTEADQAYTIAEKDFHTKIC